MDDKPYAPKIHVRELACFLHVDNAAAAAAAAAVGVGEGWARARRPAGVAVSGS